MAKVKTADSEDQALIKQLKDKLAHRRWIYEKSWYGNLLYHAGHQWTVYDPDARRWRQRKLSPSVPTPITNLFRSTMDTVKSAISQHEPRFQGTPTQDTPRAVAAAGSVDTQLQVILKEGNFKRAKRRLLDWQLLTGNAFVEIVWDDTEESGLDAVPMEQCQECLQEFEPKDLDPENPVCTNCGSNLIAEMSDKFIWSPRGEMRFDNISPFEVYLDPAIEELEDQPYILLVQSYTSEQVYQRWGYELTEESGYTAEMGVQNRDSIAAVVGGAGSFGTSGGGGFGRDKRVVVYRAFIKYHKEYPEGAYVAITSSGKLLEKVKPFPWKTKAGKGKKFYPLIHYRFGTAPGRAWGYTPADDLLPKQYQLNKAESLFTLIMSRMANPVWLIPSNTNPSRITGEIGIQIEYTPVGQAAPMRVPGAEAPQSLVKYITDIRQAFDELSGAFAAVRGRSMGSRTPVGTVQSLQERGFGRWATVFQMLEEGYQDLAIKSLEIWRQKATTPRVQAIRNAVGGFSFSEFVAADWDDGVDVEVEAGSTRPHTQQERLQSYMQMAQIGAIDMMDEAQKIKMLEDVGLGNLRPGVEEDTKAAYKENATFMEWARNFSQQAQQLGPEDMAGLEQMLVMAQAQPPVIVTPIVDDHAVHFLTHRRLALTEEFKALPPQLQSMMFTHMTQHQMDLPMSKINMQMTMAMQGAGPGQPGQGKPGTGPGGGSAHAASTKEMGGGVSNPNANK